MKLTTRRLWERMPRCEQAPFRRIIQLFDVKEA